MEGNRESILTNGRISGDPAGVAASDGRDETSNFIIDNWIRALENRSREDR